ncbi:ZPR1 zinc finger domain-containing protein, partial [Candidatus Woesearchaeota archaeon]|nr:ZPR1 zinc finger domain-containing protein [Candidatus Woesearchaeota archaeon]
MKKQFIILPLIFFAFLFSVSAEMRTEYIFKDSNGNYLNDVDIVVYNCLDANCQNVQIPEFAHTGNSNDVMPNYNIIVNYPRALETSNGYAVYFYRDGYLPLEYFVTAYGDGTRTYERTFNKKQECRAPIDSLSFLNEVRANEPLVIDVRAILDATAHSAFGLTDNTPWYVPQDYKEEFYSALTNVVLTITNIDTGEVVFRESLNLNIYADDSEEFRFTWIPRVAGNYEVLATTSVPDAQCASSVSEEADKEFRVLPEEPRNMCYTLLNNLMVDDVNPRVGQDLEIQIDKISNYADADRELSPLPTNINLMIEKDDNIVYETSRVFTTNPDSVNPVELSFSWAPEELGHYTISVDGIAEECPVADNQGESESIGLNVSIEPSINHDPVFQDLHSREIFEGNELAFILEATDIDEDQLYFTSTNLPEGATLDRETGLFRWTPSHDFVSHTFIGRIRSLLIGVPEEEIDVPSFGKTFIFSMTCEGCGYRKADVESAEQKPPCKFELDVTDEKDLSIRVVKSGEATVKIPRIMTIEPGPTSEGYITNVE